MLRSIFSRSDHLVKPISYARSRPWPTSVDDAYVQDGVQHHGCEGVMDYTDKNVGVTIAVASISPQRLMDQVRGRLRLKHYSLRTEQAYTAWIRRFIVATGRRQAKLRSECTFLSNLPQPLWGIESKLSGLGALRSRVRLRAPKQQNRGQRELSLRPTPWKVDSDPEVSNSNSRKNAQREREPWLLMASPSLTLSARQLVTLYARRMQIELSFRDLKSHRYGQAFEDSLTRKGPRIEVLLLLSALAAFATWLVGMACEARGIDQWLTPFRSKRRLYSVMRLGREALVRRWLQIPLSRLIEQLRQPTPALLDQLGVPA